MAYTPLLHDEQDALLRMVEDQAVYVEVVDWGYHPAPIITVGDKRVQVRFPMEFSKPLGISIPVDHFTLRLKMRNGRTLFTDTQSTRMNNQSLMVTAGMCIDLIWDIALDRVSKEFKDFFLPRIQGTVVKEIGK
jgi:hypothetical protein